MWVIILFIHHFPPKYCEQSYTFYLFFIDNEKYIPT